MRHREKSLLIFRSIVSVLNRCSANIKKNNWFESWQCHPLMSQVPYDLRAHLTSHENTETRNSILLKNSKAIFKKQLKHFTVTNILN